MKPRVFAFAASLCITIASVAPSLADDALYQKYSQAAEQAFQQQQYRKAETNLVKAIKQIEAQEDVNLARALTRLATIYRQENKVGDAAATLARALKIYQKLGFVESDFVTEITEVGKVVKIADLERLGKPSANALKESNAVVTMNKGADGGVSVTIEMPLRMEKPLNSPKLDGIALEKLVSFDITRQGEVLNLANIKGFKIHSVEKNMWVNLLDLSVQPANADGKHAVQLTAGKAGITKTVDATLPGSAFEPIGGIAAQIDTFGAPVQFALPVVASAKQPETATAASPAAVTVTPKAEPATPLNPAPATTTVSETPMSTGSSTSMPSTSTMPDSMPSSADVSAPGSVQPTASSAPNTVSSDTTTAQETADNDLSHRKSRKRKSSASASSEATQTTAAVGQGKHRDRDKDDDDDDDDDDKDDKDDKERIKGERKDRDND